MGIPIYLATLAPILLGAVPGECRHNSALEQARVSIEGARPQAALADIHQAHMRRGNCRAQLIENYRLKAMIESLLGDQERCRKAFEVLLTLEPRFQLPPVSQESLKGCLAKANESPLERRRLLVALGRPQRSKDQLRLPLTLTDPQNLADHLRVFVRVKGQARWVSADFEPNELDQVSMPLFAAPGPVELIVHILDPWDGILYELGTAEAPLPVR